MCIRDRGMMRGESSDWSNGSKQSPRHKPAPAGRMSDWSDQVEEWEGEPQVPTAMVSPRKIEEAGDGMITVTRNTDRLHRGQQQGGHSRHSNGQQQSSPSHRQQQAAPLKPIRHQESNYPYGVEPPPFKENIKPTPLMKSDVGFSQHPSQYNKPFSSSSSDQEFRDRASSSSWKCPDPGCKPVSYTHLTLPTICSV